MVVFRVAECALIWAHSPLAFSCRRGITALLGGLEVLIMLALAITFLIHPGPGSTYLAPLKPSSSPHHFGGILAGMVFSILALSGFEAPAPLAQEARLPGKFIGQAIMLSLGSIGVFYILTSYTSAIGWGTGDMAAFASNPNPYYVLGHTLWGAGWWFVVLAIINSAVGIGLACTNAASRVMYTMGRAGTLPAKFRAYPSPPPDAYVRNRLGADNLASRQFCSWASCCNLITSSVSLKPLRHLRSLSCMYGEPGLDVAICAGNRETNSRFGNT